MSRQRIDWAHHRETWINRNLNGATHSLKQLARDEDLRDDPGAIALRDVVALGRLWTKLLEVGAGLPRVHDGVVQEVPDIVAASRREMQELEGAVMELARWKRDKRAKEPSPAEASGNLGESEP